MSLTLRMLLIAVSILTFIYLMRRIRQSKVNMHDTLFWILMSGLLILMSIFPGIIIRVAELIGVQSASNFVFLCIMFLLFVQCFLQTIRLSRLESKLNSLVQKQAIGNKQDREH